jgi:hypothetical protein
LSFRPGSGACERGKRCGSGGSLLWHPAPVREPEGKKQGKGKKKEEREEERKTNTETRPEVRKIIFKACPKRDAEGKF